MLQHSLSIAIPSIGNLVSLVGRVLLEEGIEIYWTIIIFSEPLILYRFAVKLRLTCLFQKRYHLLYRSSFRNHCHTGYRVLDSITNQMLLSLRQMFLSPPTIHYPAQFDFLCYPGNQLVMGFNALAFHISSMRSYSRFQECVVLDFLSKERLTGVLQYICDILFGTLHNTLSFLLYGALLLVLNTIQWGPVEPRILLLLRYNCT